MNPSVSAPPVACRPRANFWLVIGVFGAESLPFPFIAAYSAHGNGRQLPDPAGGAVCLAIGALLFLTTALGAYWMLHARIEATGQGLRWRQFGQWTEMRWEEISDYYLLPVTKRDEQWAFQVGPRRYPVLPYWANREALKSIMETRAAQAAAKCWAMLGCRPGAPTRCEFHYNIRQSQRRIFTYGTFWLGLTAFFLAIPLRQFAATAQTIGSLWALGSLIIPLALMLAMGAGFVVILRPEWDALSRRRQWLETNADGIQFHDGDHCLKARWEEIQSYRSSSLTKRMGVADKYFVETRQGILEFTSAINDFLLLRRIIEHWIPEQVRETHAPSIELLGGAAALWTGGCPGVGERVYHYRTRTIRALLWYPTAVAIVSPIAAWIGQQTRSPDALTYSSPAAPIAALLIITLWGWWRYSSARIQVDDSGILEQSMFGPRRIRWSEMTNITKSNDIVTLHGGGKKIRYWNLIADFEGLNAEIERRTSLQVPGKKGARN